MKISVILWNRGDATALKRCINSLLAARGGDQIEIVAAVHPPVIKEEISTAANVTILNIEERANHAMLRAHAMAAASGAWFFFTEPYCTFPEDFIDHLRSGVQMEADIIGGGVAVANETSAIGWATALFEFAPFMSPCGETGKVGVTTNNVMIRRKLLDHASQWLRDGFWKYFFVEFARQNGAKVSQQPERIVFHRPPYKFGIFLRRTFHHARVFVSMRNKDRSFFQRFTRALCFAGVPIVMYGRVLRTAWDKDALTMRVLLLAPYLLCMYVAWALGEVCGLLAGPGISLVEVY
ncbi:MAG: hypothetical protein ABI579_01280 [Candidatus Sumerlaeota bacterium]